MSGECPITDEMWKLISGYPDYEISDHGRVRSLRSGEPRLLAQRWSGPKCNQYLFTAFRIDGKIHRLAIHRTVARTFLGEKPTPQHVVAHWDGNRSNNTLLNLRWATPAENSADMVRHGTQAKGDTHPTSKMRESTVRAMLDAYVTTALSASEVASQFGVTPKAFEHIIRGVSWKHIAVEYTDRIREAKSTKKRTWGQHPVCKLNAEKVGQIVASVRQGQSMSRTAREHGVALGTVQSIMRGRSWGYVSGIAPTITTTA